MSETLQEIGAVFPIRFDLRSAGLVLVALSLCGCTGSNVRDALGMGKRSPDEFAVVKRQPLIIPPGYDLRPPRPGAPSASITSADNRARSAVTGSAPLAIGAAPVVTASADGANVTVGSPIVIGSADGASTTVGAPLDPAAPASTSSPGEQALLAQTGSVAGSEIRDQIALETEGRARIEEAAFERVLAQPATTGPGTPVVISRQQTPIDVQP